MEGFGYHTSYVAFSIYVSKVYLLLVGEETLPKVLSNEESTDSLLRPGILLGMEIYLWNDGKGSYINYKKNPRAYIE